MSEAFVCKKSQEKEQECLFHNISCEPFNRQCLNKWWKTWLVSAADFRSYIKVRVILWQSETGIISELRSANPSPAPSKATVFRRVKHFQSRKPSIFSLGNQAFSTAGETLHCFEWTFINNVGLPHHRYTHQEDVSNEAKHFHTSHIHRGKKL